ncbi:hypothetical protein D9M72_358090 [compost metagenome]
MLYKVLEPVKVLVPLQALFGGFKALLKVFPLIFKDSVNPGLGRLTSPSQAINPILEPTLSITFRLFNVKVRSFCVLETPCSPS